MIMKNGQVKRPKKTLEAAIKSLSGAKTTKQISKCASEIIKLAAEKPSRKRTSPKYGKFLKAAPDLKGRIVSMFWNDLTLDIYITEVTVDGKEIILHGIFFGNAFPLRPSKSAIIPDMCRHLYPESVTFDGGNLYWNRHEVFIDDPRAFDRVNKPLSWLMNCFYATGKNRVISRKKPFTY